VIPRGEAGTQKIHHAKEHARKKQGGGIPATRTQEAKKGFRRSFNHARKAVEVIVQTKKEREEGRGGDWKVVLRNEKAVQLYGYARRREEGGGKHFL